MPGTARPFRYVPLGPMKATAPIQSHSYEPHESPIYRAHLAQRHTHDARRWWTTRKQQAAKRWALTFLIGAATAVVGYTINVCVKALSGLKFRTVKAALAREAAGTMWGGSALLTFVMFNAAYVLVASATVYLEPVAAGSGIPEIKVI